MDKPPAIAGGAWAQGFPLPFASPSGPYLQHGSNTIMGIFSRTRDIIAANVTDLLDRAEDPNKMIRMIIMEMEETLVEVRASAARTIGAIQPPFRKHTSSCLLPAVIVIFSFLGESCNNFVVKVRTVPKPFFECEAFRAKIHPRDLPTGDSV